MVESGTMPPGDASKQDIAVEPERISALISDALPAGALKENIEGHSVSNHDDGFGKLWHKRFWIRLPASAVSPETLIETWKEHYSEFWPKGSRLYESPQGLDEGEVAAADIAMIAGTRVGTGIIVTDSRDRAFRFATLQGHTFSGTITFSSKQDGQDTVAQVDVVMRASDPLYEVGMPLGGHQHENKFWKASLVALARYFGVEAGPESTIECIDKRRKWSNASNIVHNAFLHTAAYLAMRPFRRFTRKQRAKGNTS